jgi:hypothetical protein
MAIAPSPRSVRRAASPDNAIDLVNGERLLPLVAAAQGTASTQVASNLLSVRADFNERFRVARLPVMQGSLRGPGIDDAS